VQPLHFPDQEPLEEHLGQGRRHHRLCEALYQIVRAAVGLGHTVGADQFVYFDGANPKRCLAPDTFVTLDAPDHAPVAVDPDREYPACVRLSRDAEGRDLFPTTVERLRDRSYT
jgi:hypothetical protein